MIKKIIYFFIKLKLLNKYYISKNYFFKIVRIKNNDLFFGYYDFDQFSQNQQYLLALKKSENSKDIEIGYYDVKNYNKFNKVVDTSSWSWQLGNRLKWSQKYKNSFYYNHYNKKKKRSELVRFSIDKNTKETFKNNFFDISKDETFYISINYGKLFQGRSNYGFKIEKNSYDYEDGILLNNFQHNSQSKLIISLDQISKTKHFFSNSDSKDISCFNHYLNHISISPNSFNFLFFDCWNENNQRHSRIFIADINGGFYYLKNLEFVSHYCWIDNHKIFIFCKPFYKKKGFYIYNLKDKEFSILKDLPNIDGHPSITKDGKSIIIDFYQNNFSYRKLISYNIITRKLNTIGFFYDNNYKKNSDVKCDLHSRPSNGNYITFDYPSNDFREIGILKQK